MSENFEVLGIIPTLDAALKKENIVIPTDIQQKVIPEALKNKDLIARSETGSGKTLAYLLPLFQKVNALAKEMQAIILVPTHELAIQILRQIERLSQNSEVKLTGEPIIGNVNIDRQIERLKSRPHIIVGSPGRILELIKKKKISAHTVKTIVLDEADRLMDDSNIDNVKAVIKTTLKERQLLAFSASISKEAEAKAAELMKEPVILRGEENLSVPDSIEHIYFVAEQRDKLEVLRKLTRILNPQKAIVFINNQGNETEISSEKLKYHGLKAASIHGATKKLERKKALDDFKSGKIQLLIASDIAARGLDIQGVTHIFNLNVPEDPKDYLHRAGRTGRKGNSGMAVSIATERELEFIKKLARVLKINISEKSMYEGKIVDGRKKRSSGAAIRSANKPVSKPVSKTVRKFKHNPK